MEREHWRLAAPCATTASDFVVASLAHERPDEAPRRCLADNIEAGDGPVSDSPATGRAACSTDTQS